jgi:hypothetical protein
MKMAADQLMPSPPPIRRSLSPTRLVFGRIVHHVTHAGSWRGRHWLALNNSDLAASIATARSNDCPECGAISPGFNGSLDMCIHPQLESIDSGGRLADPLTKMNSPGNGGRTKGIFEVKELVVFVLGFIIIFVILRG